METIDEIVDPVEAANAMETIRCLLHRYYRESLDDIGKAEEVVHGISEVDHVLSFLKRIPNGKPG